jgi:putative ABC transport system permease protein
MSGLRFLREPGMGASVLVAAISSAFGAVLIIAITFIGAMLKANPYLGDSRTLAFVLSFLGLVIAGVAVYVGAIVTANTFTTIVAGRTRRIALMRLIGATARSQRREVASQGLIVGVIGAAVGLIAGTAVGALGTQLAKQALSLGDVQFALIQPIMLLPAIAVALTTWAAAWVGSRPVLNVAPLEAIGGSVPVSREEVARRRGRHVVAIVLFAVGGALLALGVLVGLVSAIGLVIAFFGGVVSFTGLALGSTLIMPPVLRLIGRAFGGSAAAKMAAENALRYPERSSRMTIGVVMGVTLVTMFAVATATVKVILTNTSGGHLPPDLASVVDTFSNIMMGLVGVSAVIAAVGLVNLLTIGIVQRRRELGLLRALGLSSGQVRGMVLLEAAHVTVTAVITGLVLGTLYGWVATQSLLGSVVVVARDSRSSGLVWPAVPLGPVLVIVAATALLTLIAAAVPTRLATRVSPVEALAV